MSAINTIINRNGELKKGYARQYKMADTQPHVSLKDIQGAMAAMKAKNGAATTTPASDAKIDTPKEDKERSIENEKQPMQTAGAKDTSTSIQEPTNKEVAAPKTMSELIAEAKLTTAQEALVKRFSQLANNLVDPKSSLGENVGKLQSFIKDVKSAISNLSTKEDVLSARKLASELNKISIQCRDKIKIADIDVSKGLEAMDPETFRNALQQQPFMSAQRIGTNIAILTETHFGRVLDVEEEVDVDKRNKAVEKLEKSEKELETYLNNETQLVDTFANLQGQIDMEKKTVAGVPFFPIVFAELSSLRELRQEMSFQKFKENVGRVDSAEGSLNALKETIGDLKGILQEERPENSGRIRGYIRMLEDVQKSVNSRSIIHRTTSRLIAAAKATLSNSQKQLIKMEKDFKPMDPARGKRAAEIRENMFNDLDSLLDRIDRDKVRSTLSQARRLIFSRDREKIHSTINELNRELAEIQQGVGHGKLQENLTKAISRLGNRLEKLEIRARRQEYEDIKYDYNANSHVSIRDMVDEEDLIRDEDSFEEPSFEDPLWDGGESIEEWDENDV